MPRDKVGVLLAMRQRAVEQARYALGACLVAETDAKDKVRAVEDAARRDRATAVAWHDSHHFKETAAIRQTTARAERRAVLADLTVAEANSEQARGVVSRARAAAEAVEQLIAERTEVRRAEALEREQHVLDDIVRARLAVRLGRQSP